MSGFKKVLVSISEEEYQRLREAEKSARTLQKESQDLQAQLREQSQYDLRAEYTRIEGRQQDFQATIQQLDEQVQQYEGDVARRFVQTEQNLLEQMQSSAGSLYDLLRESIQNWDAQYQQMASEESRLRQEQLHTIEQRLSQLSNRKAHTRQLACQWVEAVQTLQTFIQQNYPHDFFSPGEFERLERQANLALENIRQGAFEAGLTQAQQSYTQFSDFRLALEKTWSQWIHWLQVGREQARELYYLIEQSAEVAAIDMDSNLLPETINVDEWTDGKLSKLQQICIEQLDRLENEVEPLALVDLKICVEETLPSLHKRLERLIQEARMETLNAQIRINIADIVIQALEGQGFVLQDAGYVNGARCEFSANVKSLDGSQVKVEVLPVSKAPGRNLLQLRSSDREQRSEHELRQRAREVGNALKQFGLRLGANIGAETPENEDQPFEQIEENVTAQPAPAQSFWKKLGR